jgi:hypothetical protein
MIASLAETLRGELAGVVVRNKKGGEFEFYVADSSGAIM